MHQLLLVAGALAAATTGCVGDFDFDLELDFGDAFSATAQQAYVVTLGGQTYVTGCVRGWLGCTAALPDLTVALDNVVIDVPATEPGVVIPDGLVYFDFLSFPGNHLLVVRTPIDPVATVTIAGVEAVGGIPAAPVLRGPGAAVVRSRELVIAVATDATDARFAGTLVSTCGGRVLSVLLDPDAPQDGVRFAEGELGLDLAQLADEPGAVTCSHAITLWTTRTTHATAADAVSFILTTAAATPLSVTSTP